MGVTVYTIQSGTHDAFQADTGTITNNGTTMNPDQADEYIIFWWDNIAIPQGTVVTSAVMAVNHSTNIDAQSTQGLYFEDADDSAAPTTSANNISSRTRTTAVSVFPAFTAANGWNDYDVTSQVQEVVDRPGWVSGNAMAAIVPGDDPASDDAEVRTFDGGFAATLTITIPDASGHVTQLVNSVYLASKLRGLVS